MRNRYQLYPRKRSRWPTIALLVFILAAVTWYFMREYLVLTPASQPTVLTLPIPAPSPALGSPSQSTPDTQTPPPDANETSPEPPPLADSDDFVREQLKALTALPETWLEKPGLARSLIGIINDFAEQQRTRKNFRQFRPAQPFQAEQRDRRLFIAAESYRRYDSLVAAIDSITPEQASTAWNTLKPLAISAFAELAYPESHKVEDMLKQAASEMLSAPVIDSAIELKHKGAGYQFADRKLEQLNPTHKQMLRLGPDNTRRIQAKIKQLLPLLTETDD